MPSSRPLVSATRSGATPRYSRARARRGRVGRIEPDLVGPQRRERLEHARRAAAGVLVLVQPQAVVELGRLLVASSDRLTRQAHLDRCGVRGQSFGARERHDRRRQPREARRRHALHRHHAHEVGRAQAAAEARGAGGRQHVVRAGRVVAGRLRGVRADEDGAGGQRPPRRATRGRRRDAPARCGWRARSPRRLTASRRWRRGPRASARRCRGRRPARRRRAATRSASGRLQVMRIERASGSCSACATRSAAIHVGPAGAGDDDDLGRAGVEVDRAVAGDAAPWRRRRSGCPGPTILSTRGTVAVPYASAAIACAPPTRNSRVTPASSAAAITTGSGRGQTTMISRTPATRAGIAVISSDEGSGKRPPGT